MTYERNTTTPPPVRQVRMRKAVLVLAMAVAAGTMVIGAAAPAGAAASPVDRHGVGQTSLGCDWYFNRVSFFSSISLRNDGTSSLNADYSVNFFHSVGVRYEYRQWLGTKWGPWQYVRTFDNGYGGFVTLPSPAWNVANAQWNSEWTAADLRPSAPFIDGSYDFRAQYAWLTYNGWKLSTMDHLGWCSV